MNEEVGAKPAAEAPPPPQRTATPRGGAGASPRSILLLARDRRRGGVANAACRAPTVTYVTQPATRGTVARTVTATGTVNPVLTIIVGSYVSGVIQQLSCDYNTQVKTGQVCAKIDPRPYQAVVDQEKANLAVAKAQLEKDQGEPRLHRAHQSAQSAVAEAGLGVEGRGRPGQERLRSGPGADRPRRGDHPAVPGRARGRASQSRLHRYRFAGRRHRGVAQRDAGPDGRRELPDADAVPDRHRPHEDAGRHQCQRKRHRRRQSRATRRPSPSTPIPSARSAAR